ncbi:unnamed protein product [Diatraea saccharalis]|uniref:DUF4746 domain-containing protein n=1 Tax=Diatraea saccharalis TaxID=40085 RepID=A0A9N9RG17_9NEOP|nr:unnamed protein product [Diatraea saccharalis]
MFGANGIELCRLIEEELHLRQREIDTGIVRPKQEISHMLPEEAESECGLIHHTSLIRVDRSPENLTGCAQGGEVDLDLGRCKLLASNSGPGIEGGRRMGELSPGAKLEQNLRLEEEYREQTERLRVLTLAARKRRVNDRMSRNLNTLNFILFWPHCHKAHYDLYEKWDMINVSVAAKEILQITEEGAKEALYMSDVDPNEACLHALLNGEALVVLFKMSESDTRNFVKLMRYALYEEIPVPKEDVPPEKQLPPIPAYERYATISKTAREVRRERYEARMQKLREEREERERLAAEQARIAREQEEERLRLEKQRQDEERMARIQAGKIQKRSVYNFNTRNKNKLAIPNFKLQKTRGSFLGKCIAMFNKVPQNVIDLPVNKLKIHVKNILMGVLTECGRPLLWRSENLSLCIAVLSNKRSYGLQENFSARGTSASLPAEPEPQETGEEIEGEETERETEVTDEPDELEEEKVEEEEVFHSDVSVEGEEYIPPGGLFVPGLYSPPNALAKANGLAYFFPKIVQELVPIESEFLPPHVLVMFSADKRHDVQEIINQFPDEILNAGIFVGDDPMTAEHIAYTIKQYDKMVRLRKHLDRVAVMVSRKRSLPLLQLAGLNPCYISSDNTSGERDCLAMFPVGYGDDYEDEESVKEEEISEEDREPKAADEENEDEEDD